MYYMKPEAVSLPRFFFLMTGYLVANVGIIKAHFLSDANISSSLSAIFVAIKFIFQLFDTVPAP